MFREFTSVLVAVLMALWSVNPAAAQYSGPVATGPSAQYPALSQPADQPTPNTGFDPNGVSVPDSNPEQDAAADQKHGVARVSLLQGDVNIRRGDNGELTAAALNAPLVTQDRLQTSEGSRAEVQLDSANLVRLAPNSDLGLASLEYRRYQLQLGAGTMIFRVLRPSEAQVEVDTPNVGFRPLSEGDFRLSVLEDGTSQFTARSGQAEIFGPRGSERLSAGQTVLVRGDSNDPEFRNIYANGRDQFDDWSAHRDADLLRSQSYQYVSADIPGADDLDRYGNWVPSQYGQVWAPQGQPADWSPYSTGQWAWQDYYGWSWVDSAPWGWAPYHYGRWFNNGNHGWCWWPGAIHSSYFWRPALVGFFGWGGFGIGVGFGGGLGWCPLAPFESFHRWWGPGWYGRGGAYGYGGRGFGSFGNFARNIDVARVYRNAAFRGGAITARYGSFGGPHQRFSTASRGQLMNASSFRGGPMPISPSRASYQFSNRTAVANPRLAGVAGRQFFQSSRFATQRTGGFRPVQSNSGNFSGAARGIQGSSPNSGHGVAPNLSNGYGRRGAAAGNRPAARGWQRFGDPGRSGGALRQGFTGSGSEPSGWHSFGQPGSGSRAGGAERYSTPGAAPRAYQGSAPNYSGDQQRYNAPNYSGGQQRYSAPNYGGGQQRYNAPNYGGGQQRYSAPNYGGGQQRYSAPNSGGGQRFGGGGSSHSYGRSSSGGGSRGSGGGGSSHGGSGGGGGHSSGGGGHHR